MVVQKYRANKSLIDRGSIQNMFMAFERRMKLNYFISPFGDSMFVESILQNCHFCSCCCYCGCSCSCCRCCCCFFVVATAAVGSCCVCSGSYRFPVGCRQNFNFQVTSSTFLHMLKPYHSLIKSYRKVIIPPNI